MKRKDALDARTKTRDNARGKHDEAIYRAFKAYRETKEQADIAYRKALKQAIDKQAKKEAAIAYKMALEQAKKVRDEIMDEAHKAFTAAWEQSE